MSTSLRAARRKSPTAKKRLVTLTLRELTATRGLSPSEIAKHVGHDSTWVSKVLKGETTPSVSDVRVMLAKLFDIDPDGPKGTAILEVTRLAKQRGGWWQDYRAFMPEWFSKYVGLESEASYLRTFECQVIPGLMQTEDYIRATLRSDPMPAPAEQIDKQVELRLMRQELLAIDAPPQIRVVLDEAVLRRQVGGTKVMRGQIEHLLDLTERPNVQIQVLTLNTGAHSGFGGPFVLLEFPPPEQPYPDVADSRIVYIDTLTGAHWFEQPHELAAYTAAWDGLKGEALRVEESRKLMRTIARELTP